MIEEKKYVQKLLEMSKGFDVEGYRNADFANSHSPFEGTPKKHPHDDSVMVLLTNPFENDAIFYEFSINSVGSIEDLGTITSDKGQTAPKLRVWVKKGMTALKNEPFLVK